MSGPISVQDFCRHVLEEGGLDAKLAAPRRANGDALRDDPDAPALEIDAPARSLGLRMRGGAPRLPHPNQLASPEARAVCLARFAHHELMAVELFAWALLRWPLLPGELRAGWLHALEEEQIHCRLYLDRLAALGDRLEDHVQSDYFWKQAPAIAASPHGARAFLAAMGLTLEQANLDFSLIYRDGFRIAGDEQSARVCQRIHDDEIRHVRLASDWLMRLSPDHGSDQVAAYDEAVPFPLAANRAKGRRFDTEARRRAGLSDAFIEHVRVARSSQEKAGAR
ncbi:MAG: DUF455 family protein [Deltaproteobacteria bacterium]|nr:DUF455 family protein [Deltaproteobacteria bacterium]